MTLRANDVMTRDVFTVTADETCSDAAHIMCEKDVGAVPVVDPQGAVVGIVTDRDVCVAAYHSGKALPDIPVKEAMSADIISCRPDDGMERVIELMEINQVRRLPVIDDDGLLRGFIATADIARSSGDGLDEVSDHEVSEVMGAISQPHA